MRQSYHGEEVQRIQRGGEEVRVCVRLPESERRSVADLARLRVTLPNGDLADLRTIARVEETRSVASIKRIDGAASSPSRRTSMKPWPPRMKSAPFSTRRSCRD